MSSLAISIRRAPFWPADMHTVSSCTRMMQGAKTGYATSLTSMTSPNSWTTYQCILNRILTRSLQSFFFSLHFLRARKNLCYQGTPSFVRSPKIVVIVGIWCVVVNGRTGGWNSKGLFHSLEELKGKK